MGFAGKHDNRAIHVGIGSGGGRSSKISRRTSATKVLGMATSAIWKATERRWLMTLAPILISFSFRLQAEVEIEPENRIIRFSRWVLHDGLA